MRKEIRELLEPLCSELNTLRYELGHLGEPDVNSYELAERIAEIVKGGGENAMD